MKKILITFIIAIFLSPAFAQDEKSSFILSLEPAYVIINGLKPNFEFQLKSPSQWIVIGPQLYQNGRGNDREFATNYYDKMSGFGLDVYHKFYGGKRTIATGVYMGYGVTGQYYMLDYKSDAWVEQQQNGLPVLVGEQVDVDHKILKYGLNLVLGYQYIIDNFMTLDMYLGAGIRYANNDANVDNYRELNDNYLSVGYQGMILLGVLKFGMMLR